MNRSFPALVARLIPQRTPNHARTASRRGRATMATSACVLALCVALSAALSACGVGSDALVAERVNGNAVSMTAYQQFVTLYKDESADSGQAADWQSPSGRALLSQMQASSLDLLTNALLYHEQVARQHLSVSTKDLQAQLTALTSSLKSAEQQYPNDAEFRSLDQAIKQATTEAAHNPDLAAIIGGRTSAADVLIILAYSNAEQQALTAHAKLPTATVRLIEVATRQQAESLRTQVQHGADFAALAKAHSLDSGTGQQGGALGVPYFYVGQLSQISPALDTAIFGPSANNAKTSYVIVPLDTSKNSKYVLAEVTNRGTTAVSKLNDPTTEGSVLSGWLSVVLKPAAAIQQYVAVDPTPTTAPAAPQG